MKDNNKEFSLEIVADILGTSKRVIESWSNTKLVPHLSPNNGKKYFKLEQLSKFPSAKFLFDTNWDEEAKIKPNNTYKIIELFAGAGGLALGLEKAGFKSVLLNEINKDASKTLKYNRKDWNVVNCDIKDLDFTPYRNKIDVLTGGFPCQAFSYAGKKLGFEDTRGTLFYEFARAVKETNPKVILAENVKGLASHESGKTLQVIKEVINEIGYDLVEPEVLKAIFYRVPQKRERIFLVAIRKEFSRFVQFKYPAKFPEIFTMRDALKKGRLFKTDVPEAEGQVYPKRKKEIMSKVPPGGYWRDLPENLQREYMRGSYFLGGGKTGLARRLSWDEPSLTLTCAPAQKQTERCHPEETRPLTIREYARIQTFPDEWHFCGSLSSIYKQIGNAVPVNLALSIGRSLVKVLNEIERCDLKTKKQK
tara:strand:+ start:7410 stop:8672 length:1263 start_codon:yes stop_codon:yes gene_type:complete